MDEDAAVRRQITESVKAVFEAGERQEFARLRQFHAEDAAFSRWANRPGGPLLEIGAAHAEEEALFGALAPGTHVGPEEIRVDCFGPVAVSTFNVRVRGADGAVLRRTRGTLIWHLRSEGWRIVHEHFSP